MIGIVFGLLIFVAGMALMWIQWQIWQKDSERAKTAEDRRFFYRKFRRRTLIGSMIAIVGAMLCTFFYADDPRVRLTMIGGACLILLLLLAFALVDAMAVYVHFTHGKEAGLAQKKLAEEYKRMRDKAAESRTETIPSSDDSG